MGNTIRRAIRREQPAALGADPPRPSAAPHPRPIREALAERVKGQADPLARIATLLALHTARSGAPSATQVAPHALVVGPTGCGKTLTFRVAADLLDLPFAAVDCTALVPSGIVGLQIEDVLGELVASAAEILDRRGSGRAPGDALRLAERGVVFLDEFDKIRTASNDAAQSLQNRQVQRRLLKLAEGARLPVAVRSHEAASSPPPTMLTRGLLIVAAGSFADLESHQTATALTSADVVDLGIAPELVARLPVLVRYDPLALDDLVAILGDEQVSPLTPWRDYFAGFGVELAVDCDALHLLAHQALDLRLGARGLQQVTFPVLASLADAALGDAAAGRTIRLTAEAVWRHGPGDPGPVPVARLS